MPMPPPFPPLGLVGMDTKPLTDELSTLKGQLAALVKEKEDKETALAAKREKDAFLSEVLAAVAAQSKQPTTGSATDPLNPLNG